jgi:hypothetical protein
MDAHRYHIQGPQHKNETKPMARVSRLARELELLRTDPPPGVAAWLVDEADLSRFHASKCCEVGRECDRGSACRLEEE